MGRQIRMWKKIRWSNVTSPKEAPIVFSSADQNLALTIFFPSAPHVCHPFSKLQKKTLHLKISNSIPSTKYNHLFSILAPKTSLHYTPNLGFSSTTLLCPGGFVTTARLGSWRHKYLVRSKHLTKSLNSEWPDESCVLENPIWQGRLEKVKVGSRGESLWDDRTWHSYGSVCSFLSMRHFLIFSAPWFFTVQPRILACLSGTRTPSIDTLYSPCQTHSLRLGLLSDVVVLVSKEWPPP